MPVIARFQHPLAMHRLRRITARALTLAPAAEALSDEQLRSRFLEIGMPNSGQLAESLALVREAARRTIGLRAYPVQLTAAAALFDGVIAEMRTGEGKTLVIALAAALASLEGKGVHVAVPNPYLASRDSSALSTFYSFLGLRVGVCVPEQSLPDKQDAYRADITYAVHSELGFDYLRDHLGAKPEQRVQRGLHFVIVDEADSILIDEARTPLIISHPSPDEAGLVKVAQAVVASLQAGEDLTVDEREKVVSLTEAGLDRVSELFLAAGLVPSEGSLYEANNLHLMRYVDAALKARFLYHPLRDYLVQDGELRIVDVATGRILAGRRWQDGLHQALEAKEGIRIQPEMETAAEITYQSYFGLYRSLSGLTGTALAAREEFRSIYGRKVLSIPTHLPVIRKDYPDLLFQTRAEKFKSIVDDVVKEHCRGRPILIGTGSVEESEAFSAWLTWASVPHRVLNARQNAEEASIIADAGLPGAVTVTTNMSGRGTDIVLGGHPDGTEVHAARRAAVLAAGGLYVMGTQRHDSRRTDDQLRGRAGRQGDPGASRFYLSLEDDLLRIFGASRFDALSEFLGKSEGGGRHSALTSRAVEQAQKKVEELYFQSRQQLAETDAPLALQRAVVYGLRDDILTRKYEISYLYQLLKERVRGVVAEHLQEGEFPESWDLAALTHSISLVFGQELPAVSPEEIETLSREALSRRVEEMVCLAYDAKRENAASALTEKEQLSLLAALDRAWRAHLTDLDAVRQGIHLRAMAQETPAVAFAREAHQAFAELLNTYQALAVEMLLRAAGLLNRAGPSSAAQPTTRKISRLSLCPCGSGLRFKHCHGKLAENSSIAQNAA